MINPQFSVCKFLVKYENIPPDLKEFFSDLKGNITKVTDIAYRPMNLCDFLIIDNNIKNIKLKLSEQKYNI